MHCIIPLRSFLSLALCAAPYTLFAGCASDAADGGTASDESSSDESSATTDQGTGATGAATTAADTASTADDSPATTDTTGDDPEDTSEDSTGAPADSSSTEPSAPSVVATVPADGAVGVFDDSALVVQFDVAMDKTATQLAYSSVDIPADAVTFAWNDAGDELTVTPGAALMYAVGGDPTTLQANTYGFTITTAAQSLDGVPLTEDVVVEFSTLRRLEQVLEREVELSGNIASDAGPLGTSFFGDRSTNAAVRFAVSFDLTALASNVVEVEQADLRVAWTQQGGNPWAGLGGGTVFQHVAYANLDEAFDAPATGDASGLFGGVGDVEVVRDVAPALTTALEEPATYQDLLQLRMRWLLDSDNDGANDSVTLATAVGELDLAVTYLAP